MALWPCTMASNRHVKEVRELLSTVGEGHHAMGVVKAMREARYEPESWSQELKAMQRDGSLVGFIESCKKKNGDGDADNLVEGLRDLLNMQSLLSNLADSQSAKYSAGRHDPEQRDAVYNDTKQMALGALKGIANCVDSTSAHLIDMVAAQTSVVERFDFQVDSAVSHLASAKSLVGAAGMKKLRVPTADDQHERHVEPSPGLGLTGQTIPLPCFAKYDDVGAPFAVLKDGKEKPFLSQFRVKNAAEAMYESGVVFRGVAPVSVATGAGGRPRGTRRTGVALDMDSDDEDEDEAAPAAPLRPPDEAALAPPTTAPPAVPAAAPPAAAPPTVPAAPPPVPRRSAAVRAWCSATARAPDRGGNDAGADACTGRSEATGSSGC